ncbi:MAG: hypothetical protein BRD44_00860 [Bacteroidetes bacterium QS_7_67_15]|nr:MAG: hypothetical protein BRD44_00860 [Bacteroidetes bacterium QS_7_67_15]
MWTCRSTRTSIPRPMRRKRPPRVRRSNTTCRRACFRGRPTRASSGPCGAIACRYSPRRINDGMPVHTVYRQPYYRVRVGNFTSRSEAERALQFLSSRYGDAFIVRDDVTVTQ